MSAWRAGLTHGQVLIVFVALLPALVGMLGLVLDGGYYLSVREAAQFAASTAARTAGVDVQNAAYGTATSKGQIIGQQNVAGLRLAAVTVTIAYHDTPDAAPTAAGWYTTAPTAQTASVRATVSGAYPTLFLPLVGIATATVERVTVVTLSGGVLPMAVCTAIQTAQPSGPWTIWEDKGTLCSVNSWDGYTGVGGLSHTCAEYKAMILPGPPTARVSASTVVLNQQRRCPTLTDQPDNWLATAYYLANPVQPIVVVNTGAGNQVAGCVRVRLTPDIVNHRVVAVPEPATVTPCAGGGGGIRESY